MTERCENRPPRPSNIKVVVRRSEEPMDFDVWAERYVRAVIAADRAKRASLQPED